MYYLLLRSLEQRQGLIAHLRLKGIAAVFHYIPLHSSDMGQRYGGRLGDCPVAEKTSECLVRLPLFFGLRRDDQEDVIREVKTFVETWQG